MRYVWIGMVCLALLACGSNSGGPLASTDSGGGSDNGTADNGNISECQQKAGNGTELGQQVADMSLTNCAGETVNLSDSLCGDKKLVLIYMASGWCQPCREKQPTLEKWYKQYGPQGLDVIVILPEDNTTDPATKTFCQQWATDYGLSFPVVIDPTKKFAGQFLTGGAQYPVVMLVQKDWYIVYKKTGASDPDLESTIQAYLNQ